MSNETSVTVSETAAKKILEAIDQTKSDRNWDLEKVGLRLAVKGGGCSGFMYHMDLEDKPSVGDSMFESNGLKVYVDPISIRYLKGATVEWGDVLGGGGLRVVNPNATATCGCGESFTTDDPKSR